MYCGRWILTAVLVIFCLSGGEGLSTGNGTCPELRQCQCKPAARGFLVLCVNVTDLEVLKRDLAVLVGRRMESITLDHVNMTVLPAHFFENITVRFLGVQNCPLDSLDDDAFVGLGQGALKSLTFQKDLLTKVPRALRALKSVTRLYLNQNRIQALGNELAPLSGSLHVLSLQRNGLASIHEEAFAGMSQLRKLWLSRNKIRDIPTKLFQKTRALEVLDLNSNFISNLGSVFNGLPNLQELYLRNNSLTDIYRITAAPLPSLMTVVLDDNPITTVTLFGPLNINVKSLSVKNCNVSTVHPMAFTALASLSFLDLSQNNIQHINGGAFHRQGHLTKLNASKNLIDSLEGTFSRTRRLQVLGLSENRIRDISKAFWGLGALRTLHLENNEVEYLPDGTFATNSDLREIYLDGNRIAWLGRRAFQGAVTLKYLSMGSNRVVSLNGSLSYMPTLQYLHLEMNRLRVFGERDFVSNPNLRKIVAFQNQLIDVRGAFRHLWSLNELQLQNNSLGSIHRASFPQRPIALTVLSIQDNPLICDCQLSWLTKLPRGVIKGDPICEGPPWMTGVSLLNSTTADALHAWPQNCDDRCTCTCQEDGDYGKYTYVNCSNADMTLPPDTVPEDTYLLDLTMNRLQSLSDPFADSLPRLESLLLDRNLLTRLDADKLPTRLRHLSIRNNTFTRFPMDVVSRFNLSSLSLSGNPWACDCEDYPFRQWAAKHEKVIADASSTICAKGTNPRVSSKPFMSLQQTDLCPPETALLVTYGVTALVLLTLGLCMAVVYLKRERQIKVWLYAHGVRCVKEYDVDKDKVFDVFLSFSSKDSDWAYANLVPGIEKAGFSVCTYDRNFKGGFLLTDIIKEAVDCSRRTLLLLTENFVQSEWCRWEFRIAHHKALEDKINRLIVVVPESVPEGVDEDLALYVDATNYLRWGENHFWDKLMYSLPKTCETRDKPVDSERTPLLFTCK